MDRKTGVIIVAAGLSQRMGAFKPLLPLGDKVIIEHVVDNALGSGIDEVIIVAGREADKIREQLAGRAVKIVDNPDYQSTDMLHSVKCGIRALSDSVDCFFVTPGDMPLISRACYRCMLNHYRCRSSRAVVQVRYQGSGGHPILISRKCREKILNYTGSGGLKEALRPFADDIGVLEWHNSSIMLDADTPFEYERLKDAYERQEIPGKMVIFNLLNSRNVSSEVIQHAMTVEKVALVLADKAIKKGYPINTDLVSAGALLHDIEKGKPDHAERGAALLREIGYSRVAPLVAEHMFLSAEAAAHIDERAIVYLADKLVDGHQIVSLDDRYQSRMLEFQDNPEVLERIAANKRTAMQIKNILG